MEVLTILKTLSGLFPFFRNLFEILSSSFSCSPRARILVYKTLEEVPTWEEYCIKPSQFEKEIGGKGGTIWEVECEKKMWGGASCRLHSFLSSSRFIREGGSYYFKDFVPFEEGGGGGGGEGGRGGEWWGVVVFCVFCVLVGFYFVLGWRGKERERERGRGKSRGGGEGRGERKQNKTTPSLPSRRPCKRFANGHCKRGWECEFSHELCHYDMSGVCLKGDHCTFVHLKKGKGGERNGKEGKEGKEGMALYRKRIKEHVREDRKKL